MTLALVLGKAGLTAERLDAAAEVTLRLENPGTAPVKIASIDYSVDTESVAGVLKGGRKMTTVAKCALDITQFGGVYLKDRCVVDGNLVTVLTEYTRPGPPLSIVHTPTAQRLARVRVFSGFLRGLCEYVVQRAALHTGLRPIP